MDQRETWVAKVPAKRVNESGNGNNVGVPYIQRSTVDPVDLATEVEVGNGHRIRKKRKGERHAQTAREKEQNPFKTTEIKDEKKQRSEIGEKHNSPIKR